MHLEGAVDGVPIQERIEAMRAMAARLGDPDAPKTLDPEEEARVRGRDIRSWGTAVFIEDNDAHYLLTARHVLAPPELAAQDVEATTPEFVRRSETPQQREDRVRRWILPIIFRVPGLDELLTRRAVEPADFLMGLQAGSDWMKPYTFSPPEFDLAIVSMRDEPGFARDLLEAGYEPVSLADLADGPSREGAEIASVGFPHATAIVTKQKLDPAIAHWASSFISVPVMSFGHVAMSHEALPYFWADISLYPGNSGGPVMEDDKLIGIVSEQAAVDEARIPFARVIRAEPLAALVDEQRTRDAEVQSRRGGAPTGARSPGGS